MRLSFEVPGRPVPQGSMRNLGRRMVHDNAAILAPWRESVGWHALAKLPKGWDPGGPMAVEAVFWLPRPKSHYRRGGGLRPSAPWWPAGRVGDVDKLARAVLDALTTVGVWGDDSQVVSLAAEKFYAEQPPGRLLCTVHGLTERGEA